MSQLKVVSRNRFLSFTPVASRGFSMVEMMLAMLIGSIILAGIFTIFANTKDAQRTMQQNLTMIDDARFGIEQLSFDLRHASVYGGTNLPTLVECRMEDSSCSPTQLANDCYTDFAYDIDLPLYSPKTDDEVDTMAVNSDCPIDSHLDGTDVIVVRFSDTTPTDDDDLEAGVTYIRSNYKSGILFTGVDGGPSPDYSGDTNDSFTQNYRMHTRAYYISDHTDTAGDGIPSLRRIELTASGGEPVFVDQTLMPGVENLQIQFGVDSNGDGLVDKFVNSSSITSDSVTDGDASTRDDAKVAWRSISAVKIWVMTRAERPERNLNTASASGNGYDLGGFNIPDATLNDGYQRVLLNNVVRMRNMDYDAVSASTTTTTTP